jgi:NADH:ubiquinone oxidoreductase subunit 6 (chain J)
METVVFLISAAVILSGALGVIFSKNPVHSPLFMVQTLFGVPVLFVLLEATFLAPIQVIVYAGAIVILFVFVITLLGVDRAEDLKVEPYFRSKTSSSCFGSFDFWNYFDSLDSCCRRSNRGTSSKHSHRGCIR